MKTPRLYLWAIALTCIIALVIGMAGAAGLAGPVAGIAGKMTCHAGPEKMLDRPEGQGIEVSAVRLAFESSDKETAGTPMHELMETHKDLMPFRNASGMGGCGCGAGMLAGHLECLEEQGYNVSAKISRF